MVGEEGGEGRAGVSPTKELPAVVTVGDEEWRLYSVAFRHGGSRWSVYLYARTWDEAEAMLDSLKATGEVDGELHGWLPGDTPLAHVEGLVRDLNEPDGAS